MEKPDRPLSDFDSLKDWERHPREGGLDGAADEDEVDSGADNQFGRSPSVEERRSEFLAAIKSADRRRRQLATRFVINWKSIGIAEAGDFHTAQDELLRWVEVRLKWSQFVWVAETSGQTGFVTHMFVNVPVESDEQFRKHLRTGIWKVTGRFTFEETVSFETMAEGEELSIARRLIDSSLGTGPQGATRNPFQKPVLNFGGRGITKWKSRRRPPPR